MITLFVANTVRPVPSNNWSASTESAIAVVFLRIVDADARMTVGAICIAIATGAPPRRMPIPPADNIFLNQCCGFATVYNLKQV
jgi:hypothetical protein